MSDMSAVVKIYPIDIAVTVVNKRGDKTMGYKWEVYSWHKGEGVYIDLYSYREVYKGNSVLLAIWHFWRQKRVCGCVKIEWRG